jgi:release factor glutamine methyltransferase
VGFVASHWFRQLGKVPPFDLVVSNPPYLADREVDEAEPEVRSFEPRQALAAPDEGFADLSEIIKNAPGAIAPGGLLALETGILHHDRAAAEASAAGFSRWESVRDLTGRDRIFLAWR